jgi:hypothetical protein
LAYKQGGYQEDLMNQRRTAAAAATVFTLATVALLFAACGGGSSPGVASIKSSSTSTTIAGGVAGNSGGPPTQAQLQAMTKFAQCVRKHGLPNFPDPPYSNGELRKLGYGPAGPANPSPKFAVLMQEATNACHTLALAAGFVHSQAEQEQHLAQMLKISECMQANGVSNFPDPNAQGGFMLSPSIVANPSYSAAAKKCGGPPISTAPTPPAG